VDRAEQTGRYAARRQQRWILPLGRAGYAAIGVVYAIVGVLAARAAMGVSGGDITDSGGALARVMDAPFGRILLAMLGVGMVGYAFWRLVQALLDTERQGENAKGLAARAGFAIAGVVYAGLGISALAMSLGRGGQPSEEQAAQDRAAWLMSQPFGAWLVIAAGAIVLGVGIAQFVRAYRASFREKLHEEALDDGKRRLVEYAGRLGFAARGVVFLITGGFLLLAGSQARPDQAKGLGGALASLASQPYGAWLLGLVAVGLVAYGAYMLLAARYRRMVL
jgi:hypothetical protein